MPAAAALVLLLLASVTAPASGGVQTVDSAIPADCSVDVTARLQAFLDAKAADGDTVRLLDGACYRLDGTVTLTDRHDLTFIGLGSGATFKMVSTPARTPKVTHEMFAITGGSGITASNITVQSTNTGHGFDVNREWFPAVAIHGAANVDLDGVHGIDIWGDFLSIGPDQRHQTDGTGAGAVLASQVTLRNSTVDHVGRHAVSCTGCEDVTVDHDTFADVGYHVVDVEVEGDAWHADRVAFTNNTVTGYLHHSILASAGIGAYVRNVTVSGTVDRATHQTCSAPVWALDTGPSKTGWTITGNDLKTLGAGLDLAGVDHVTATGNTVRLGHGGCTHETTAIAIADSHDDTVTGNDFRGADRLLSSWATFTGTACGNRLTLHGPGFDRPATCPEPIDPPRGDPHGPRIHRR
jgi:hypothetical protein